MLSGKPTDMFARLAQLGLLLEGRVDEMQREGIAMQGRYTNEGSPEFLSCMEFQSPH